MCVFKVLKLYSVVQIWLILFPTDLRVEGFVLFIFSIIFKRLVWLFFQPAFKNGSDGNVPPPPPIEASKNRWAACVSRQSCYATDWASDYWLTAQV